MAYYGEHAFGWATTLFAFVLILGLIWIDYLNGWPIAGILKEIVSSLIGPIVQFIKEQWG